VPQELDVIQRAAAAAKVAWKHDAGDAAEPPVASMEGARAPLSLTAVSGARAWQQQRAQHAPRRDVAVKGAAVHVAVPH
jgi:hypothetical protein